MVDLVGETVDAEAGIHRFHPKAEIQRGEHEVTTITLCMHKQNNDKWDIQYNPQST
jgi:hypothetical protein